MNNQLKYSDIFVPGGYPVHTYNPRESLRLENKIEDVLNNLCKLVIVTGYTKSGKTVLVQKTLPRDRAVWIDGGSIGDENDFWATIIDQLDLFQPTEVENTKDIGGEISGDVSVEGSAFIAKGSANLGSKITSGEGNSLRKTREMSSKVLALKGLRSTKQPLVIDDFHYLPKDLQGNIVRALKPLIFTGLPVVFIAIPHRRYDAVRVEKEMTGRISPVNIPLWEIQELKFIPETGFGLLQKKLPENIIEQIVKESMGSPHLTQEFCREICKIHTILAENKNLNISQEERRKIRLYLDSFNHNPLRG
jgi:hypothetical protein